MADKLIEYWAQSLGKNKEGYIIDGDIQSKSGIDKYIIRNPSKKITKAFLDQFEKTRKIKKSGELGENNRFHSYLMPVPYVGDIRNAKIYYLTGNPGYEHLDYYLNREDDVNIELVLNNLIQNGENKVPFFPFDSRICYTGGHRYWVDRLQNLISCVAEQQGDYIGEKAYDWIGNNFAVLELTGYPSQTMNGSLIDKLNSTQKMRDFLNDYVLDRMKRKECVVILARSKKLWFGNKAEPYHKYWIDGTTTMARNGRVSNEVIEKIAPLIKKFIK